MAYHCLLLVNLDKHWKWSMVGQIITFLKKIVIFSNSIFSLLSSWGIYMAACFVHRWHISVTLLSAIHASICLLFIQWCVYILWQSRQPSQWTVLPQLGLIRIFTSPIILCYVQPAIFILSCLPIDMTSGTSLLQFPLCDGYLSLTSIYNSGRLGQQEAYIHNWNLV